LLVVRNNSEFFSENVFEFFYGSLISLTLSSLLFNLISEELNFLIISVTLFVVILNFSILFVGLLDLFIKDSLKISDFSLINHALSSFIFNDVSELLNFIIVLFPNLTVFFNVSGLFFQDSF
jgi:hypothetical protein